ncbi:conserved hypothetical protein [Alteracholeplasma palmae J233]|uniref:FMN-binding domain-containing protein n=1 Tax=Alteracholeplasma palmae (strain ATCC 49389 / J233) TaxID=1318466 RepID=U4KSF0_ALTPJ|nr:hypothetical protein [Alteracholeplasma palmae]CCV64951.1 conserved hypothetical protein [Alteracholeplasma palmae J233]
MKKENIKLCIGFGLMALISVLLVVIYQNFMPTTKVDKLFSQKVVLSEKEYLKEGNLIYKQNVESKFGKKLGTLYFTETKNGFGSIELFVAFDTNDKVLVSDNKIEQTQSYIKQVREYILKNYQGIYYENVEYVDGAAGATTIGVSRNTVKQTVQEVINYHYGLNKNYIEELLGETYEVVGEISKDKNVVITKVKTGNTEYTVYQYTANGLALNSNEDITLLIALDGDKIIKKALLPSDLYKHSGGNWKEHSDKYVSGLIGKSIDLELPEPSGATNSTTLIKTMIEVIQGVVK